MESHLEYQRDLQSFEDWLEEEQETLGCYTQLEGDVEILEDTLQRLQVREDSLKQNVFTLSDRWEKFENLTKNVVTVVLCGHMQRWDLNYIVRRS